MSPQSATQLPPRAVLNRMINGLSVSQAIFVAAELGVADTLHPAPLTPAEIASHAGASSDSLHRILRALATVGIFREDETGRFEQTPLSDCLRTDAPGSLRAAARMVGSGWYWDGLGSMLQTARSGEKYEWKGWQYFEENKRDADVFNQAMTSHSALEIHPVIDSYDFAGITRLMDVGGSYGALLTAVLAAHPHMQGILFDAPSVIEKAHPHIAATPVADRCQLIGGDFFASVPPGADAIVMKHVLHDWNDEEALRILRSCQAALAVGGKLLIVEGVIRPGNDPAPTKMLDLVMLLFGGRERTEPEYRALLDFAGFDLARIVPTASPVSVIEAQRVRRAPPIEKGTISRRTPFCACSSKAVRRADTES